MAAGLVDGCPRIDNPRRYVISSAAAKWPG
jgi:hypothetical protein